MAERYWLIHPNGGRQLIDPHDFDIARLTEQVRRLGGELVVETDDREIDPPRHAAEPSDSAIFQVSGSAVAASPSPLRFEPPLTALAPLFRSRFGRIHSPREEFSIDINARPTSRVLGGYYKRRKLVRVYTHDRVTGRRPLEELFDTFLHEMAHHLEYTEPQSFHARGCGRVPGTMHSPLFWRILGELKERWRRVGRQLP